MDRLHELELRRRKRQGHASPPPSRTHQRRYPANTLGPQEDVVEQRRGMHRTHVSIPARAPQTRNILLENLLLLAVLAGSIWGLYALTIYLLTHS
ncbi:MAG: hypothetical protein IKJ29_01355 [Akkermansia sp.]|nr:hypothetical protein [Akkermansia sp.]